MTHMDRSVLVPALTNIATRLRIDSVLATSASGTGHPTSCASAAELIAALFFAELRFDPKDPQNAGADRFVLSKGHAAPILYAAWAEAGLFDRSELLKVRDLHSDLEGHRPAPVVRGRGDRVARPGSAPPSAALNARRIDSAIAPTCSSETGSRLKPVWEAAEVRAGGVSTTSAPSPM
jgi:transketolase